MENDLYVVLPNWQDEAPWVRAMDKYIGTVVKRCPKSRQWHIYPSFRTYEGTEWLFPKQSVCPLEHYIKNIGYNPITKRYSKIEIVNMSREEFEVYSFYKSLQHPNRPLPPF